MRKPRNTVTKELNCLSYSMFTPEKNSIKYILECLHVDRKVVIIF